MDITERKHAEASRRQAQKMEAMGTLAGGVTHDFNNILGAIVGFTQVVYDDIVDRPDSRDALAQVLTACRRAKELLRQILSFSRRSPQEPRVVEDESMLGSLLQRLSTRLGYHPCCVANPTHALDLLRSAPSRFALVITDMNMPQMSGVQLAAAIRQLQPDLPIVLATGYAAAHTLDQARAMGIRRILDKPYAVSQVGQAVHEALHGLDSK